MYSKFATLLLVVFVTLPWYAHAVTVSFSAHGQSVPGGTFDVQVVLNAEDESINTIGGTIVIPQRLFEIEHIHDGGSVVSLWIEQPESKKGAVSFAGAIPGGYRGEEGLLFTMQLKALAEGNGIIQAEDVQAFLSDGLGTKLVGRGLDEHIVIETGEIADEETLKDGVPPEAFTPLVITDPDVFGGSYIVVFATQDKGSGTAYFEIQENGNPRPSPELWRQESSPYVLHDQALSSYIHVKAVDNMGNVRIATISPEKGGLTITLIAILALMFITGVFLVWKYVVRRRIQFQE